MPASLLRRIQTSKRPLSRQPMAQLNRLNNNPPGMPTRGPNGISGLIAAIAPTNIVRTSIGRSNASTASSAIVRHAIAIGHLANRHASSAASGTRRQIRIRRSPSSPP